MEQLTFREMNNDRIWHLVARRLSREATLDELRELERMLEDDPSLAYNVEVYIRYFEQPLPSGRSEEVKKRSWEQYLDRLEPKHADNIPSKVKKIRFSPFLKWSAAAASLVIVGLLAIFLNVDKKQRQFVKQTPALEMNTMPGTRSKMVLPDGTIVWLNSDSRITYNTDFGKNKREVTLTGEAYFDVAHNAAVPMVVHARSVNIWVKGTAFNVRNYPEARVVETSLIRGAVELTTNADPSRKILLKPNEKITIEAPVEISPTDIVKSTPAREKAKREYYHIDILRESALSNTIPEVSWVQNKLVFDNELFTDVIGKMEKWYNMEIVLQNSNLAAKQFSGAFDNEDIFEALSALQIINHFSFEIKGNKVFIK